ncbi:hypothetical protein P5V15_002665 [Pogonomyrmex californicus]
MYRLNGINDYPVYILGEITLTLFDTLVNFHIVPNDFPIPQAGILSKGFFQTNFSKIGYENGYLDVSGLNVPFFSSETIIAPPRSESSFYVRINPEVEIGYLPKLKIAHGIYSRESIVENVSGKAYINIVNTLNDERVVQVLILRLRTLDEIFDDHEINLETYYKNIPAYSSFINNGVAKNESKEEDIKLINNPKNEKIIDYEKGNLYKDEITITNKNHTETKNIINKIQQTNKIHAGENSKNKNKNKTKDRKNKNFNPDIQEGNHQNLLKMLSNAKILGEGNLQTPSRKPRRNREKFPYSSSKLRLRQLRGGKLPNLTTRFDLSFPRKSRKNRKEFPHPSSKLRLRRLGRSYQTSPHHLAQPNPGERKNESPPILFKGLEILIIKKPSKNKVNKEKSSLIPGVCISFFRFFSKKRHVIFKGN